MKGRAIWAVVAGLVVLSAVFYAGMFALYPGRAEDISFYTLLDLAFIPLNVLIVGVVIDRLLAARERRALLHKLNMVIGAFFAEVGSDLIDRLLEFDADIAHDRPHMLFDATWKPADYARNRQAVAVDSHPMDLSRSDVTRLAGLLREKRPFILGLLENGNLLEHESFTDMLWAVTHLAEELAARRDLTALPAADARHIELDMSRAYGRLLGEYLLYVSHLKADYPYLFSFAVRTNPFDSAASAEIVE